MKICKGWLQALLLPAPRGFASHSRVLARLASLTQIGELGRRLGFRGIKLAKYFNAVLFVMSFYATFDFCILKNDTQANSSLY